MIIELAFRPDAKAKDIAYSLPTLHRYEIPYLIFQGGAEENFWMQLRIDGTPLSLLHVLDYVAYFQIFDQASDETFCKDFHDAFPYTAEEVAEFTKLEEGVEKEFNDGIEDTTDYNMDFKLDGDVQASDLAQALYEVDKAGIPYNVDYEEENTTILSVWMEILDVNQYSKVMDAFNNFNVHTIWSALPFDNEKIQKSIAIHAEALRLLSDSGDGDVNE